MSQEIEQNEQDLSNIYTLASEATQHAKLLQKNADDLRQILDSAKSPTMRALDAANAYNNINEYIQQASEAARKALETSENAASMVSPLGVGNKSESFTIVKISAAWQNFEISNVNHQHFESLGS